MNTALSTFIGNYFFVSYASLKLIEQIIIGLIKVRDVNLTELAFMVCGKTKLDSRYRKLQRFFCDCNICYSSLAKLLVKITGIEADKWLLTLDRTNWKFGKLHINILVLAICGNGIAIPVLWSMLDKNGGSSNHKDRKSLISRFIDIFGLEKIAGLLGDREFIGDRWLSFLEGKSIPFYIRIREDITIGRGKGELVTANRLVRGLKNGEYIILKGKRYLGTKHEGPKVFIAACRNDKGELLIIATNDNPELAFETYKKRWEIETLFACLKSQGFNFENTHMTDFTKIEKMLGLLAITFTFCHVIGIWRHEVEPIKLKAHKRKAMSTFRYGLDYIRKILFYIENMKQELEEIIDKFIKPAIPNFGWIRLCY